MTISEFTNPLAQARGALNPAKSFYRHLLADMGRNAESSDALCMQPFVPVLYLVGRNIRLAQKANLQVYRLKIYHATISWG